MILIFYIWEKCRRPCMCCRGGLGRRIGVVVRLGVGWGWGSSWGFLSVVLTRSVYVNCSRVSSRGATSGCSRPHVWGGRARCAPHGSSRRRHRGGPRIQKTVAIYPFLSDFRRVLEIGNTSEAYDELFRYFKFHDPFHETEEKIMATLAYIEQRDRKSVV